MVVTTEIRRRDGGAFRRETLRRRGGWIGPAFWLARGCKNMRMVNLWNQALGRLLALALLAGLAPAARAALQFDVFLGYGGQSGGMDGIVREAGWFPVVCEVFNDGPAFKAVFELSGAQSRSGQNQQLAIELPTNTRKRFVVPVFAAAGRFSTWDARLLDERGKVRAEHTGLRPRDMGWNSLLLGAIPRSFAGLPSFPDVKVRQNDLQPVVARMQIDQFPDNPIALEGLNVIYLNSEKALELKVNQVAALLSWIRSGGRLILAVEQPGDVNATPWLTQLLPCEFTNLTTVSIGDTVQTWLSGTRLGANLANPPAEANPAPQRPPANRIQGMDPALAKRYGLTATPQPQGGGLNRPAARAPSATNPFTDLIPDPAFDEGQLSVATGPNHDGRVELALQDVPLVITANRGRGQVIVLGFSPEREPFRSWKNRSWFWAKIAAVPPSWYTSNENYIYGGTSIDGVFGAMIDSKQVRKLPVEWLLLLLVVYLIVIGPLDHFWLRRIGRQMLTWLTFPAYVIFFSLLIYFIGYKLRAGETEWNELHLVDIWPLSGRAEMRGRTYASVYSPVNAKYHLTGEQNFATLRGEFQSYGAGQEGSKANLQFHGNGYSADIFVPVWSSQLYVSDWVNRGPTAITASVTRTADGYSVQVENHLDRALSDTRVVCGGRVYLLGALPASKSTNFTVLAREGQSAPEFVRQFTSQFATVVQQRNRALGDASAGRLEDLPTSCMVA